MNAELTQKRGRPAGAKNIETVVVVPVPACPKCGSHERTKYEGTNEQSVNGVAIDGRRFRKTISRRTKCLSFEEPPIDQYVESVEK